MTSLVSFSNLVDGAALSETFESYNPYTGKPWARIRVSSDQVPPDRYDWQDGQSVRHDEAPMTKAVHSTSRRHGSRA